MQLNFSPLRYPGGKSVLTSHFIEVIKKNKLSNITYVEPFAGGAGAALSLLFLEYVDSIWINDADYNIYAFWFSVLNHSEEFIDLINRTEINIENWYYFKSILNNQKEYDILTLGYATFYLNRCNHSGILNAGPIGGKTQKGKWKIYARFNKKELIKRIIKISNYKDRIFLTNSDALHLFPSLKEKYFLIYFDPPYYKNGKELYLNYFSDIEHEKLSSKINSLDNNWILTYDNTPEIIKLYESKRHRFFNLNYSANKHKLGKEIIFYSDNIKIPQSIM